MHWQLARKGLHEPIITKCDRYELRWRDSERGISGNISEIFYDYLCGHNFIQIYFESIFAMLVQEQYVIFERQYFHMSQKVV